MNGANYSRSSDLLRKRCESGRGLEDPVLCQCVFGAYETVQDQTATIKRSVCGNEVGIAFGYRLERLNA